MQEAWQFALLLLNLPHAELSIRAGLLACTTHRIETEFRGQRLVRSRIVARSMSNAD
uniref:Uncharacterized protein n=1 Tax=Setaria italica TaxID=4555 RepID=K4A4G3_SETIT